MMNNPSQNPVQAPQREKALLSADPNKAMQEMMITIDKLRASLVRETEVLNQADTKAFMDMQDDKIKHTTAYMEEMMQLITRKEELKSADPALKEKLQSMRLDMADVTNANLKAIDRMKNGMKRLGDRIMQEAQIAAKTHEQIVYGSNGQLQTPSKGSIGVSESV